MTSKLFWGLALMLLLSVPALAQNTATPGWGWVRPQSGGIFNSYGNDRSAGVGRDAAGYLYVAGAVGSLLTSNSTPILTPGVVNPDAFLAKYDPAGNLIWLRAFRGADADEITQLVVLPNGRCIVAGTYGNGTAAGTLLFNDFGSSLILPGLLRTGGGQNIYAKLPFVASVDTDGFLIWATCPTVTNGFDPQSMAGDSQGNVYLSATVSQAMVINGTVYPQSGPYDAALLKLDATGQVQWVRQAGGAGTQVNGGDVVADQTGSAYWLFSSNQPFTFNQAALTNGGLLKLTTATNQVQWVKGSIFQLATVPNTNYSVGGYGISGLDAAAGKLYMSVYSYGQDIAFNGPGSPIAVPRSNKAAVMCLAQCDLNGQVQWVKPMATLSANTAYGSYVNLKVYPSGSNLVLLTNTAVNGTTNFVGDATTYSAAQGGLVAVVRFNLTTGLSEWVRTAGTNYGVSPFNNLSQEGTNAAGAAVDPLGNVYVAGLYYGPARFGGTTLGATNNDYLPYLAKLDQTVLAARPAAATGRAWQPYPNPATGTVQLSGLPPQAQVSLRDALGRAVRRTSTATLDLSGLAPGLYLLQVSGTTEPYQSQRLTVE